MVACLGPRILVYFFLQCPLDCDDDDKDNDERDERSDSQEELRQWRSQG
jgi:hypothetical protein